jgi:hypothetical protein
MIFPAKSMHAWARLLAKNREKALKTDQNQSINQSPAAPIMPARLAS